MFRFLCFPYSRLSLPNIRHTTLCAVASDLSAASQTLPPRIFNNSLGRLLCLLPRRRRRGGRRADPHRGEENQMADVEGRAAEVGRRVSVPRQLHDSKQQQPAYAHQHHHHKSSADAEMMGDRARAVGRKVGGGLMWVPI